MRVLLAMRISTGEWLLRAEASDRTVTQFRDDVASALGLLTADVSAIAAEGVTPEGFRAIQRVLEAGVVHGPAATVWPEGDPDASLVYDATSVDAVTAARRRRLLGNVDEQLERLWLSVHYAQVNVLDAWPDSRVVTPQEKAAARAHLLADRVLHQQLERVSADGSALKGSKGWIS